MPKHLLAESIDLTSDGIGLYAATLGKLVELFGVERAMVQLTTPLRRDSRLTIEIGDTVTLTWPRWGWDEGKAMRVVSIELRPKTNTITYVLWG